PALDGLLRLLALQNLLLWIDDPSTVVLRIAGRYRWLAGYGIVARVVRTVAAATAILAGGGLPRLILAHLPPRAALPPAVFVKADAELRARFGLEVQPAHARGVVLTDWRAHAKTMVVLSDTDTVKTLTSDLDAVIINFFTTPGVTGVYRAAQ